MNLGVMSSVCKVTDCLLEKFWWAQMSEQKHADALTGKQKAEVLFAPQNSKQWGNVVGITYYCEQVNMAC